MIIDGRRAIAGLTDNADGAAVAFTIAWYTPANVAITCTGQIVPLSGSIQHSADTRAIRDNHGNDVTVFWTNERVVVEIVAVPFGATGANTLAAAITAATLPAPGGWMTISNAPDIPMGSFANVLESADWMYNGDGRIEMASDGEWGIRFSATRRSNLTKAAAAVV